MGHPLGSWFENAENNHVLDGLRIWLRDPNAAIWATNEGVVFGDVRYGKTVGALIFYKSLFQLEEE